MYAHESRDGEFLASCRAMSWQKSRATESALQAIVQSTWVDFTVNSARGDRENTTRTGLYGRV